MGKATKLAKVTALTTALAAHGALALVTLPKEHASTDGSDGMAEVKLGTSFEDLVTGTLTADTPAQAQSVEPDHAEAAPVEPTPLSAAPQTITAHNTPLTAAPSPDAVLAAPASKQTLTATDETVDPPVKSVRPKQRETQTAKAAKPVRKTPTNTPKTKAIPTPKGNAQKDAVAGKASGSDKGKAKSSGTGTQKSAAGNAAQSNYDGLVMNRIARAKRKEVDAPGSVTVSFKINHTGGLTSVSIVKKSGSDALDRAAVKQIQRAAPFPKPPAGARQSFTIVIKGI